MAVPSLRAGLSDAVPAHLRGAGFGAFNLVSVVFGQAAASIIVFSLAGAFDNNIRTAFFICSPPVFIGALVLLRARDHLDADAAKIFEAILKAMQAEQDAALVDVLCEPLSCDDRCGIRNCSSPDQPPTSRGRRP